MNEYVVIAVLLAAAIICAAGWLFYWVGSAALSKYILDKGYDFPTDEELKLCCAYVWRRLFRIS